MFEPAGHDREALLYQTSARASRELTPLGSRAVSESYEQRAFAVPPDARELIVVRHGASAPLAEGETFPLVGGHGDPPLAPQGHEQAVRVAERLTASRSARCS